MIMLPLEPHFVFLAGLASGAFENTKACGIAAGGSALRWPNQKSLYPIRYCPGDLVKQTEYSGQVPPGWYYPVHMIGYGAMRILEEFRESACPPIIHTSPFQTAIAV